MRISSLEEYGLRCTLALARVARGGQLSIADIADREGLSTPYASKLLAILRKAGIASAVRGRGGGQRPDGPRDGEPGGRQDDRPSPDASQPTAEQRQAAGQVAAPGATLVELAGLPPKADNDGASLVPLLVDPNAEWTRPVLMTEGPGNHAIRTRGFRLDILERKVINGFLDLVCEFLPLLRGQ